MAVDHILGYSLGPLIGYMQELPRRKNRSAGGSMPVDMECNALSAMADTSLLTGTGRLKIILEDMACCLMKLLDSR